MTEADDHLRLHVEVMGVVVAIDAPDVETRDRLAHQWSRAVTGPPVDEPVGVVTASSDEVREQATRDYAVTTDVTMAALRGTVGRRINFHAGGVADDNGRVLALVAGSGTGKTTATRLLAQRLGYLSDETVSLDPDGFTHAHAKPLSVLVDPERPWAKEQLSPDDLGLQVPPAEVRLGRLVVLRRGVPDPRGLVPLDPIEGALELIEQSSSLGALEDPLRSLVRLVDSVGGVWALEYDEIADHLDTLVDLASGVVAPTPEATYVRHPPAEVRPADWPASSLGRTPWVDALEVDDDLVVLLGSRAVRLDHLGATVWLALSTPRTVDDLVAAAEERHGHHPEAPALVRQAVDVLVDEGLVAWGTPA